MKKNNNKGMSGGKMVAVGAAAAALGSAAYYFLGPKGKQHQRSAKKWTKEAASQIAEKAQKAKNLSESVYANIVDGVVMPYVAEGVALKREAQSFTRGLKSDWKHIKNAAQKSFQANKKEVKAKVRKATQGIKSKTKSSSRARGTR